MSDAPAVSLMTADELARLPDDGNQYELVEGCLIRMPPSSYRSGVVATNIAVPMSGFVKQNRLGMVAGADGGLLLRSNPDTVRTPDVSFVRAARIPAGGLVAGYWPGAPDLAVEVLSPSDRYPEVHRKVQEYLDAGTRLVWVVDPESRTATAFHADGRSTFLSAEDVLPGFQLSLGEVWV